MRKAKIITESYGIEFMDQICSIKEEGKTYVTLSLDIDPEKRISLMKTEVLFFEEDEETKFRIGDLVEFKKHLNKETINILMGKTFGSVSYLPKILKAKGIVKTVHELNPPRENCKIALTISFQVIPTITSLNILGSLISKSRKKPEGEFIEHDGVSIQLL